MKFIIREQKEIKNQKVRALARKSALTYKARADRIRILEDVTLEAPKTKEITAMIGALELIGIPSLMLVGAYDPVLYKSCRNIPMLQLQRSEDVSTYSIMRSKMLLIQNPYLIPFDCYLIRYRKGAEIKTHTDPVEGKDHHRINVVLKKAEFGGHFWCNDEESLNIFAQPGLKCNDYDCSRLIFPDFCK